MMSDNYLTKGFRFQLDEEVIVIRDGQHYPAAPQFWKDANLPKVESWLPVEDGVRGYVVDRMIVDEEKEAGAIESDIIYAVMSPELDGIFLIGECGLERVRSIFESPCRIYKCNNCNGAGCERYMTFAKLDMLIARKTIEYRGCEYVE